MDNMSEHLRKLSKMDKSFSQTITPAVGLALKEAADLLDQQDEEIKAVRYALENVTRPRLLGIPFFGKVS